MNPKTLLVCLLLTAPALAGCTVPFFGDQDTLADLGFTVPDDLSGDLAAADLAWPDLTGTTVTILTHGAFVAFDSAAERFQELTGADVVEMTADDTGSALARAVRDKGSPQADILYGVDNALLWRGLEEGIYAPYTPQLAPRVAPEYVFFDAAGGAGGDWVATPVDHGYIALNIDHRHAGLDNVTIDDLFKVRANADKFVTQDPRTSTPGLGFLLITIGVFGDGTPYDWRDYWSDLFQNGVLVTSGWTQAYETHFSGGYGIWTSGHIGDRPIVTSYTSSPAYEAFFGAEELADVLLTHRDRGAVFHQIQTMGILDGTRNLAAAQAWIEFTLTDDFQALAAPENAVYPVVPTVAVDDTYGAIDPTPGTFDVVGLDWQTLGQRLEGWVHDWTDLCEGHSCL